MKFIFLGYGKFKKTASFIAWRELTTSVRPSTLFTAMLIALICSLGCTRKAVSGPDKQFSEMISGAATGAGAGAVTGFQIGAASGPGAAVGAGIGAISGAIQGASGDLTEDQQIELKQKTFETRQIVQAQQILQEHYKVRAELFPTRDIFPADLFFYGDEVKLRPEAKWLVSEIARMNKTRLAYSRLVIAVYAKSKEPESPYALHLTERRSRELVDAFVKSGLEPRRLSTRPEVISEPLLIDPHDKPERYNQAVEFIAIDR